MSYLIVRHTVEDFARWKPYFDSDAGVRKAAGSQGGELLRSPSNPNDVVIVFRWDSMEHARRFTQQPALAEIMQKAGVISMPEMTFLEEVEAIAA